MPYREELGLILSNVQAKGQEAFTLETPTPSNLDPCLSHTSTSLSPAPSKVSQATKSKGKRVKEEDDSDDGTLAPRTRRKVDIGLAIAAFSEELARARKAKEIYLTDQQKAVQLLESKYKERIGIIAFIKATSFLQDDKNAGTFLTLQDVNIRDRWLEIKLTIELLPYQL
jgi:hypothetical protein